MKTMKFHRCKRCNGTLILDKDEFGWYEECIQCGHIQEVNSLGEPVPVPANIGDPYLEDVGKNGKKPDFIY